MQWIKHNGLVYYQFESLVGLVKHGVFTRLGGVSNVPYDSLNVGATVGDDLANVRTNRARMAQTMGVCDGDTRTTWQVHGADVVVIRDRLPQSWPPPQADGIITAEVDLPLVMRFADCVPIILYDPVQRVIGMAHAGWQGTLAGVGPATVKTMCDVYGSRPEDIICGIGPSIGSCCYEVGPEVIALVQVAFEALSGVIHAPTENGTAYFDLWAANQYALQEVGVGQIEIAELCTACHTREFYSHRAEKGRTGRFGALLTLSNGEAQ